MSKIRVLAIGLCLIMAVSVLDYELTLNTQVATSSAALRLGLSIDTSTIRAGDNISLTTSEFNPLPTENNVPVAGNWSLQSLVMGMCGPIDLVSALAPVAYVVLTGYYAASNISAASGVQSDAGCISSGPVIRSYDFQPSSDFASITCNPDQNLCSARAMSWSAEVSGYWSSGGVLVNFEAGVYTAVAVDEWGHVAISHFVATPTSCVRIGKLSVNWIGRTSGIAVYTENLNLSVGEVFNYTLTYNTPGLQYTMESANVSTPGFQVAGTMPELPQTIYVGANTPLVIFIRCPSVSYSGDVLLLITTS
ncbi:MAG: hypothetical protein ABSB26_03020 [Nitrososphaerales archaeon]|jgi:hypothetical protein